MQLVHCISTARRRVTTYRARIKRHIILTVT